MSIHWICSDAVPPRPRRGTLAAGLVAGDDVGRFLADAAGRLAAELDDELFDAGAVHFFHGAGDDDGLAREGESAAGG